MNPRNKVAVGWAPTIRFDTEGIQSMIETYVDHIEDLQ